jgi:hypothetical protein
LVLLYLEYNDLEHTALGALCNELPCTRRDIGWRHPGHAKLTIAICGMLLIVDRDHGACGWVQPITNPLISGKPTCVKGKGSPWIANRRDNIGAPWRRSIAAASNLERDDRLRPTIDATSDELPKAEWYTGMGFPAHQDLATTRIRTTIANR